MWISKRKWEVQQLEIEALRSRVTALERVTGNPPTMRLTTHDFKESGIQYRFNRVFYTNVLSGERKDVPLAVMIQMIADAAGIELHLEPSKPGVPARPVAKKKARKLKGNKS